MIQFKKAKLNYPRGSQYITDCRIGTVYFKREGGIWYSCSQGYENFNNPSWCEVYKTNLESVFWFFGYWFYSRGLRSSSITRMKKVK